MHGTTLAINTKAKFDYEVVEKCEAGIELKGYEVKAIREGRCVLKGAYAVIRAGQCWLTGAHIGLYSKAGKVPSYDPTRTRRLLLNRKELNRLMGRLQTERLTLVPFRVYTKGRRIKVELNLVRGKKKYEKKETIKKRETDREIARALKRSSS